MNEKIKNDCRDLWKNCFGDSETYMDYYFSEKCKDNHILTDIEDDHVVSMVHLNPYQLKWQGKDIKSYYIVGVATEEKFRKQGRMRELLEQAFVKMQEEQIPFTFLMPADKQIYEPFGFQTIYTQERILVKGIQENIGAESKVPELQAASVLKPDIKPASCQIRMKKFSELTVKEQAKAVKYCNEKLSKEFDIYAVRDEEYYIRLQKEMEACGGTAAVFIKDSFVENPSMEDLKETVNIAGVVPYGLENGYVEATELLIESYLTEEIVDLLLQQEVVLEKSKIFFYESYFLDKKALRDLGTEIETTVKEIIMAKVMDEDKTFGEVFDGQKVYLNEIV